MSVKDISREILRIVEFNQLMPLVVGDMGKIKLYATMLSDELNEAIAEVISGDEEKLISELCNVLVIATGGAYLSGWNIDEHKGFAGCGSEAGIVDTAASVMDVVMAVVDGEYDLPEISYNFKCSIEAVLGYAENEGFDLASPLKKINDKNFGKFYKSRQEALEATLIFLDKKGIKSEVKPCCELFGVFAKAGNDSVSYPEGKLLKNVASL